MNKKRIIVFDDDSTRRESLSIILNMCPDLECAGAFANAADAVSNVKSTQPDMVLMDIDMPQGDGINGTRQIKSEYPNLPVIMQTVFDDNHYIFEAIKAGANGYILKKTAPDKLLEQIREALDGGAPMAGAIAVKILQFFREEPIQTSYNLSDREKGILKLLVDGHNYKMIAAKSNITYFTVCNHIKKIYEKLHVNSSIEAVKLAILKNIV